MELKEQTQKQAPKVNLDGFAFASRCFMDDKRLRIEARENKRVLTFDDSQLQCRLIESRVGNFGLLYQRVKTHEDTALEVQRSGGPGLIMSFVKSSKTMVHNEHEDRYWNTGDALLSMFLGEDKCIDYCPAGETMDIFHVVVPKAVIESLAERHSDELNKICQDFGRDHSVYYSKPHSVASAKLVNIFRNIERCDDMGNYASKYMESKVLDGLSMMLNGANGSEEPLYPINLVLEGKMHDARDIMLTHYQNPPSLHELATMVGTNECTRKSAFKQYFGETVFQSLFEHRMSLASNYLLDTDLSILEVAISLGYDHQSHFCTAFRRKYGMAPTMFRELRGKVG